VVQEFHEYIWALRKRRERIMKLYFSGCAAVHIARSLLNSAAGLAALKKATKARLEVLEAKARESDVPSITPDGLKHSDATLQFLSDISPDGENKDLFVC
jgi:hypothetical protein